MTTGKVIQQAIESFIRSSLTLSEHLGEPIVSVQVGPDFYPSNRGYVYSCSLNGKLDIVVKYAPDYIGALSNEAAAYSHVQQIENVPELLDFDDGILAIEKVKDAASIKVDAFNAHTADHVLNFLGQLRCIDTAMSPAIAGASIIQAGKQLRTEFKSIQALQDYFTNADTVGVTYGNLTEVASQSVTSVHRVHGDLSFSNIVQNNSGLHFVDWEMSGISDGATDVARLLRDIIQDVSVFEKEERFKKLKKFLPIANYFVDTSARDSKDSTLWRRMYFWLSTRILNGGNHFETVRLQLEELLSESATLAPETAKTYFVDNALRIFVILKGIGAICPVQDIASTIERFQAGHLEEFAAMLQRYQWELDLRCQYATRLAVGAALCAEVLLKEAAGAGSKLPDAEKFI